MLKPVTLACGHSGCQECLAKLIRIEPNPKCPLCKQSVPSKATLNLNITLNDLTSQLEVRCTNSGCVWKGTYDSAEDHTNRCPKVRVACENEGCAAQMAREELDGHLTQCLKQKIPCSDCGFWMPKDVLHEHRTSLCSYKQISCPLGCGMTLPRCHVILHQEKCGERAIQCTVRGCKTIYRRKHQEEHVTKAASSHAVLQEGEVQLLRQIIHFKTQRPLMILKEQGVISFCWVLDDFGRLKESVASPEYRCVKQNRWRGVMRSLGRQRLSLQLVSAVNPVTVGVRVALMPGTANEVVVSFPPKVMKEGQSTPTILDTDIARSGTQDGRLRIKFVVSYLHLTPN